MRVIFMGSPEFSVNALLALHGAGHEIIAVYSQPPRPKGRGQHLEKTPVHQAAEKLGLNVFTPSTFKDENAMAHFEAHKADVAVVAAYGLILRKKILNSPKYGCINIHASLLPRWRGAAPIHRAIEAGDKETGITIMQMDAGLDTGPMLLKAAIPINEKDTTIAVHDRLKILGAEMVIKALEKLMAGQLAPEMQPEENITYAHKLAKEEGNINWTDPADLIIKKIQAFAPWPGLSFSYMNENFRVHDAAIVDKVDIPGKIIEAPFIIACGQKSLAITKIQRAGRTIQNIEEFCRGFGVTVGDSVA